MKIALIAPPWQLFHRPSVQIAALKAFLKENRPEYRVRNFHPYLFVAESMGMKAYHRISQSGWASEAVCSAMLFPEKRTSASKLIEKALRDRERGRGKNKGPGINVDSVIFSTEKALRDYLDRLPLDQLQLVGITACLNQFTAALFLASIIKKRFPGIPVLLGGSSCSGKAGPSVLNNFPWIDYVVGGEGEIPFTGLCDYIAGRTTVFPDGVLAREEGKDLPDVCSMVQLKDLDSLPAPDYDDYFREKALLRTSVSFQPDLCVEASRGCWWGRCNFCNLNIQWEKYRAKGVTHVADEVKKISERYGCLDFAFMDNALPPRDAPAIFRALSRHNRDYSFFAELRTGYSRNDMETMARGGLMDLQIGIEALSSSLLKRLNKGSRVIDNVAAMRHALEWGINLQGNLILNFPGSTLEEAEETFKNLDWLWPFTPLKPVSYWLGSGSPVAEYPEKFSISGIRSDLRYERLFPDSYMEDFSPLILAYRGDKLKQKNIWKGVREKLLFWEEARRQLNSRENMLSYRDGGGFLIIRQILPDGRVIHHRLSGFSRQLYLDAMDIKSIRELAGKRCSETEAGKFFNDLASKRLVFMEEKQVISLAVHERCTA